MDTSKMSKKELLDKCKKQEITGCSSKNKSQLIPKTIYKTFLLKNLKRFCKIR